MLVIIAKILLSICAICIAILAASKSYNEKRGGKKVISRTGWVIIVLSTISILGTWGFGIIEKNESDLKLEIQNKKNEEPLNLHKDSITVKVTKDILRGVAKTLQENTFRIIDSTSKKIFSSTTETIKNIADYKTNTLAKLESINDTMLFRRTEILNLVVQVDLFNNPSRLPHPGVTFTKEIFEIAHYLNADSNVYKKQVKYMDSLFIPAIYKYNPYSFYDEEVYRDSLNNVIPTPIIEKRNYTTGIFKIIISKNPFLCLSFSIENKNNKPDVKLFAETLQKKVLIPLGSVYMLYKYFDYKQSQWNIIQDSCGVQKLFIVVAQNDLIKLFEGTNMLYGQALMNKDYFISYERRTLLHDQETYIMNKYFEDLNFSKLTIEVFNSSSPNFCIKNILLKRMHGYSGGRARTSSYWICFQLPNDKTSHFSDLFGW